LRGGRKPTFTHEQFRLVRELLQQDIAVSSIAKTTGLNRQSVYRIQAQPERQLAALEAWYPNEAA
jgi:transposase-like protein